MRSEALSVYPDTVPLIHSARCLPGQPWEQRMTPYSSLGDLLRRQAIRLQDEPFLTFYADDEPPQTLSYASFREKTCRLAGALSRAMGVSAGDRVATLMVNDLRAVIVYFACWTLGATVVPINVAEDDERVAFILENAECVKLFVQQDQVERGLTLFRAAARSVVQVGGEVTDGALSFDELVQQEQIDAADPGPDAEALIVYTSGTTGPPKGVVLDHANLLADAASISEWHRFTNADRAMNVLPIHHVNGTVVTLVTPLYSGGSVVLNRRFRAHTFWSTLAQERCTWTSVVPTVLAFLCERAEDLAKYDLSRFRHIICGAGPLTVELARRFNRTFGLRVVHGYGLSETTCYSCFLPVDLPSTVQRYWMEECGFPSIGCPISANEMAIHSEAGEPLPPGERGEIVARGHNVMRCYFARPDANRDTFAHGWFRSGDEGYFLRGEDGQDYYFITGRIKELIIRGGVNYSPFDIDEVLNAVPGVKAAMAVGFDNDFYGEEIGAYVQRSEGSNAGEEAILAACRAKLSFARSPKVVVFGTEFPVTSTGKYQRNKLKPLFQQWKSVQFREDRPEAPPS